MFRTGAGAGANCKSRSVFWDIGFTSFDLVLLLMFQIRIKSEQKVCNVLVENCAMADYCLTCSVANFESFGKECKSGVRIQDGCDLQSLPILPKQECILGHWFYYSCEGIFFRSELR